MGINAVDVNTFSNHTNRGYKIGTPNITNKCFVVVVVVVVVSSFSIDQNYIIS